MCSRSRLQQLHLALAGPPRVLVGGEGGGGVAPSHTGSVANQCQPQTHHEPHPRTPFWHTGSPPRPRGLVFYFTSQKGKKIVVRSSCNVGVGSPPLAATQGRMSEGTPGLVLSKKMGQAVGARSVFLFLQALSLFLVFFFGGWVWLPLHSPSHTRAQSPPAGPDLVWSGQEPFGTWGEKYTMGESGRSCSLYCRGWTAEPSCLTSHSLA